LFILDVREPHEYQICNLNGKLIPLGELPRRVNELDSSRRNGGPLPQRKALGRRHPFPADRRLQEALNLKGGVLAWADEVDPEDAEVLKRACETQGVAGFCSPPLSKLRLEIETAGSRTLSPRLRLVI
jgi:rhodanese-related sulfurtransferase